MMKLLVIGLCFRTRKTQQEYLATLHASRVSNKGRDADPVDDDFDPSGKVRGGKGKRGRRGKR